MKPKPCHYDGAGHVDGNDDDNVDDHDDDNVDDHDDDNYDGDNNDDYKDYDNDNDPGSQLTPTLPSAPFSLKTVTTAVPQLSFTKWPLFSNLKVPGSSSLRMAISIMFKAPIFKLLLSSSGTRLT